MSKKDGKRAGCASFEELYNLCKDAAEDAARKTLAMKSDAEQFATLVSAFHEMFLLRNLLGTYANIARTFPDADVRGMVIEAGEMLRAMGRLSGLGERGGGEE